MKEVYILVENDSPARPGSPSRVWRVEDRDGQIDGLDYLFSCYREDYDDEGEVITEWETDYGGYYAGTAPYGGDHWAYMIEFENGHRGTCLLDDIHRALASVGARFDPNPPI
jgi:hypothetical protein